MQKVDIPPPDDRTMQDAMTDQRSLRSYIHPETGEILLLIHDRQRNGWIPSIAAMEAWRDGRIRIYSPTDSPDRFLTMPEHIHWPLLTPTEEQKIRAILSHPWIPDGQSIEGLREDQIDDFDLHHFLTDGERSVQHVIHHHHHHLLDTLRPTLMMDIPLSLVLVPEPLDRMILASAGDHISDVPRHQAFPKHLVDQVLASAEAAGQTCAITMEPIKKASASITSCGHVFQKDAIAHWMHSHNTCPECRQPCCL